eukprot:Gb_27340 [translate_table: standard]
MGIQFQGMSCVRGSDVTKDKESSTLMNRKRDKKFKSQDSLASQVSSIMSQSSLENHENSLHSEYSIRSAASLQSELSIRSQLSIQSQPSLYSQASLASVPSIGIAYNPQGTNDGAGVVCRCISTLKGHSGYVFSLAMAGNLLYSGSAGNDIRVWRHPELNEYCKFGHGDGAVKSILVAGDRIYSAHQDHRIRVWKRSPTQPCEHKLVATMPTLKDYLLAFIPPKNYVQVRRHKKVLWIEHVDTISVLSVDKNGFLYSASWDRTVKIWRPSDFRCIESFRAHDDAINALAVSSDGFVYTGSADARIKVWAKAAGEKKHSLVATLERHKSAVNALALSQDGSILYSGACDRSIIVWEREQSAQHMTVSGALRGHRRAILCLTTVTDLLCSGSADKSIRLWRRGDGNVHTCLAVLEGHRGPVKSITASVDEMTGCLIYSGSLDHDIKVWWVSSHRSSHHGSPLENAGAFRLEILSP